MSAIDKSMEPRRYSGNPIDITAASLIAENVQKLIVQSTDYACTAIEQPVATVVFNPKNNGAAGNAVTNLNIVLYPKDGDIRFTGNCNVQVFLVKGN